MKTLSWTSYVLAGLATCPYLGGGLRLALLAACVVVILVARQGPASPAS